MMYRFELAFRLVAGRGDDALTSLAKAAFLWMELCFAEEPLHVEIRGSLGRGRLDL